MKAIDETEAHRNASFASMATDCPQVTRIAHNGFAIRSPRTREAR